MSEQTRADVNADNVAANLRRADDRPTPATSTDPATGLPANPARRADDRTPVDTTTDLSTKSDISPDAGAVPEARADDLFDDSLDVNRSDPGRARSGRHTLPVEDLSNGRQTDLPDSAQAVPLEEHDPCSDKPAVHPVATGVGAAAAAAAGAATGGALGALAGPVGAAVGAVVGGAIGGFTGGYAGRHIAEAVTPSCEEHYWRRAYHSRPYAAPGTCYDEYKAAYAFGIAARQEFHDKDWSAIEDILRPRWEASPCAEKLPWARALPAICDAWDHLTPRAPDL